MSGIVQQSTPQLRQGEGTVIRWTAPTPFTVGNYVAVMATFSSPDFNGMTIGGETWAGAQIEVYPFGGQGTVLCVREITTPGQSNVDINYAAGSANKASFVVQEWNGLGVYDKLPASGVTSVASGALTQADEVIFAVGIINGTGAMVGPTNAAPYTSIINDDGGTGNMPIAAGYKIVASAASDTATFTGTGQCDMATFYYTPSPSGVAQQAAFLNRQRRA